MNETAKALEALDRIFNNCEEIDLHLPKEEQVGYDMLVDINIIREVLENQKTGHWINRESDFKAQVYYTCSVCNSLAKTGNYSDFFKYCPNCGAKMEGE